MTHDGTTRLVQLIALVMYMVYTWASSVGCVCKAHQRVRMPHLPVQHVLGKHTLTAVCGQLIYYCCWGHCDFGELLYVCQFN